MENKMMKAIVVESPFKIEVREVPMPKITDDQEVLIRVTAGGICGSDIGIYNGTNSLATYPRIIGHEFGGEVVALGAGVTTLKKGDVVAVDPVRACGECYACRHDRHNVCRVVEVVGVHRDGGFAEYIVAPAENCYRVNTASISRDLVCMVEPYSIGMQVNYRAETAEGDTVLVMGSGPIGACAMQVAKARGAKVMMTDIVPERLERALKCGADRVVNVKEEDLQQAVTAFSGGEGVSVAIDTVCSLNSVPQAIELVCPAGRVVVLGLSNKPSEIPQVGITKKETTVLGSRLNNYRFPEVISMLEKGELDPTHILSQTFPFEQVEEALALILKHPEQVSKVRLVFS